MGGERVPAPRMPSGYAASWALFTDWCAVTDHPHLPAAPDTVLGFLAGCPAAPDTQRRRVAAIDHHHAAAGHARPGETTAVRAALGRPTREPHQVTADTAAAVQAALRALPSHGWTRGMFGRRDRCLLVLSQLAGVPYQHLARLTVGDVGIADGQATIRTPAGEWTLRPADDGPLLCGPCAVTRWVRVLDVVLTRHSNRALTDVLRTADPVTDTSPHLCRSTRGIDDATRAVPLLPPIDQWGYVPFPLRRLTPHSLSRRVRDLLAGDLGDHREYPVDPDAEHPSEQPAPVPAERGVYGAADQRRAWARRRADLADLAGITDVLTDVDQRADELNRRAAALLHNPP
ncbi:MAG TPA: hypothetical protein VII33_05345 [Nakamurella sp.]